MKMRLKIQNWNKLKNEALCDRNGIWWTMQNLFETPKWYQFHFACHTPDYNWPQTNYHINLNRIASIDNHGIQYTFEEMPNGRIICVTADFLQNIDNVCRELSEMLALKYSDWKPDNK